MALTVPASWARRGRPGPRGKAKPLPAPNDSADVVPFPARRRARRVANVRMSEDDLQIAVIKHLDLRALPGVEYWHVPNGGARSKREAARFKAMGVRAGIQDVHLLRNGTLYLLELKTETGRLRPAQREMAARTLAAGARVAVAYGLDEALAQLEVWRLIRPDRSGL